MTTTVKKLAVLAAIATPNLFAAKARGKDLEREAVAVGAVHDIAPLDQLPARVLGQLAKDGGRALRV